MVVTKLISLHQTVSTEATLLIRNSVEIDNKGHTNIENMRQNGNKFSRWAKAKTRELPYVKQTLVTIFLISVSIRSD